MIQFGTGGWRAEIGIDFIKSNVQIVAQALAERIVELGQNDRPVIIGRDRRFLSEEAAMWMADVLAANGVKVWVMHRSVPTPLVMHTVLKRQLHYGIEITASHNPSNYNGIKIVVNEGRDAPVEVTEDLERRCAQNSEVLHGNIEEAFEKGDIYYIENPFNTFLDDILAQLDTEAIRQRGLRILYDSMHGSSSYPFNVLFYSTRCTVDQINANKDAFFGGSMPAPTQNTLRALSEQVVKGGYDLGMGIDGDGDRLGVVDSKGNYISANDILVLLYYYLHEYKGWKGPVVRNYATTHLLDRVAKGLGEECYEVPIGFKYISAKIDEVDAVLGGESSGGLTVRGHIHGKDSIYASALFVEMISKTGKSPNELLTEIKDRYGHSSFVEHNAPLKPGQKEQLAQLNELPAFCREIIKVNRTDGIKLYFDDDSFVICRASGTEPILRIFSEASTTEQAEGYIQVWVDFLETL